jgi:hypothetical protein
LAVYLASINGGDFCFRSLVAESGLLCPTCGTADCASYHDTWFRKRIFDLCSGDVFENFPIVRLRFCSGHPKSMFPAELWRGKATVSSVLEAVSDALGGGVEHALQRVVAAGDGHESVSERTLRRWIRRAADRVPVAAASLDFPPDRGEGVAARLENFLTRVHPHHLLALRRQWGFAILDVPSRPKSPNTAACPKPVFPHPRPPQNPPSRYVRRGSRSRLSRRGRSPDD